MFGYVNQCTFVDESFVQIMMRLYFWGGGGGGLIHMKRKHTVLGVSCVV